MKIRIIDEKQEIITSIEVSYIEHDIKETYCKFRTIDGKTGRIIKTNKIYKFLNITGDNQNFRGQIIWN